MLETARPANRRSPRRGPPWASSAAGSDDLATAGRRYPPRTLFDRADAPGGRQPQGGPAEPGADLPGAVRGGRPPRAPLETPPIPVARRAGASRGPREEAPAVDRRRRFGHRLAAHAGPAPGRGRPPRRCHPALRGGSLGRGAPRRRLSRAGRLVCGHQPAQGRGAGGRRGRRGGGRTRSGGSAPRQAPGVAAGCRRRRDAPRLGRGSAAGPAGGPEEVPRSAGGPEAARRVLSSDARLPPLGRAGRRDARPHGGGNLSSCGRCRTLAHGGGGRSHSQLVPRADRGSPPPCADRGRPAGAGFCSKRSSSAAPRTWPTSRRRTPRGQWRPCEGPGRTPGPPASRR